MHTQPAQLKSKFLSFALRSAENFCYTELSMHLFILKIELTQFYISFVKFHNFFEKIFIRFNFFFISINTNGILRKNISDQFTHFTDIFGRG